MKKDITWGSIPIIGLEDENYNKLSIKQLTAIENATNATKLNIENGHYKKYSKAALGTKRTEEERKKMSKSFKGRKLSEQAKQNMSIAAKNRKVPSKLKGKKRTEEEKIKISENRKGKGIGRIMSNEHKEKLKEFLKIKYICKYCNREIGGRANFIRYHNDNCKMKN